LCVRDRGNSDGFVETKIAYVISANSDIFPLNAGQGPGVPAPFPPFLSNCDILLSSAPTLNQLRSLEASQANFRVGKSLPWLYVLTLLGSCLPFPLLESHRKKVKKFKCCSSFISEGMKEK
jgi:hypothetical protein